MSLFEKEVRKRIGPYMKNKGFKRRGRSYYYLQNDIAFCITFEQPSWCMYTWAHINPLYIPQESRSVTYGNRLSYVSNMMLPVLQKDSTPAEIDEWCEKFYCSMDNGVLPIFQQQIATPECLLFYFENLGEYRLDNIMCTPDVFSDKLRMYTYLYLHELPKVSAAANDYKKSVIRRNMTNPVRGRFLKEADDISQLASEGDDAVSEFCNRTIQETKKLGTIHILK